MMKSAVLITSKLCSITITECPAEANEQRALATKAQQRAEQEKLRAEEGKRASDAVRSFLQDDLIRQADIIKQADSCRGK